MELSSQEEVASVLRGELVESHPLGRSFASRLDSLMKLLEIRNADIAKALHMDSSYISRIRRGERSPHDKDRLASAAANLAATRCAEGDARNEVLSLIGAKGYFDESKRMDIDQSAYLAGFIKRWLLGVQVMDSDIGALMDLFDAIDQGYFEPVLDKVASIEPSASCATQLEPQRMFYRGENFMWRAEFDFLDRARECGARTMYISSDMPALETEVGIELAWRYQSALASIVAHGCKITVIHSVDRPLNESLAAMYLWIPLYMTGQVEPRYLSGVGSQLFCHANSVCECCALSSEALRGHEQDGQYFLSTHPEDIEYYRSKLLSIVGRATELLEVVRGDDDEAMARFEREEQIRLDRGLSRQVCAGRFKNLTVTTHMDDCVVVALEGPRRFRFIIRHPKLRYVISHME